MSIRNRLLLLLVLLPTLSILAFVLATYRNFAYVIDEQFYSSFQLALDTSALYLDGCLDELHGVASNLVFDQSPMSRLIDNYYHETDQIARDEALRVIESTLLTYEFHSPYIGLIAILDESTGRVLAATERSIHLDELPELVSLFTYVYSEEIHRPHASISYYSSDPVISLYRPFQTQMAGRKFAVYIETRKELLENLLQPAQEGGRVSVPLEKALTAPDGRILASSDAGLLPPGNEMPYMPEGAALSGSYQIMEYHGEHWSLYGLVEHGLYQRTLWGLIQQLALGILLFVILLIGICLIIWRLVYGPMKAFTAELKTLQPSQLFVKGTSAKAAEFDEFRVQFNSMRVEIQRLVAQAEIDAKHSANLENQLLLSRINPHFLHNTLDNIKWLARQKNAEEVADLLTALNNLMYYNLGKQRTTTLREELQAVDDYLLLQQRIRPFVYEKRVEVCARTLDQRFPCFTLQPIVENSLLHGYRDSLNIRLHVYEEGDRMTLFIGDTGVGMPSDTLSRLQKSADSRAMEGMGIGLQYVFRALRLMYGDRVEINLDSKLNQGVWFCIRVHRQAS